MYDFREFALCRDVDPELFFPAAEPGSPAYPAQVARAKGVCADCPVAIECLEFALVHVADGVMGGLDPGERAELRTARAGWARRIVKAA